MMANEMDSETFAEFEKAFRAGAAFFKEEGMLIDAWYLGDRERQFRLFKSMCLQIGESIEKGNNPMQLLMEAWERDVRALIKPLLEKEVWKN